MCLSYVVRISTIGVKTIPTLVTFFSPLLISVNSFQPKNRSSIGTLNQKLGEKKTVKMFKEESNNENMMIPIGLYCLSRGLKNLLRHLFASTFVYKTVSTMKTKF